jgi:hypothetical protein
MPELNQDAVLKTVQHHLPTYFGKAHMGTSKLSAMARWWSMTASLT